MKVLNERLVAIARRLDWIWPLVGWLLPRARAGGSAPPKSILIFDLQLIGDMVMLLPMLQCLRQQHPAARITLVAGPWAESIIGPENIVDELVPYAAPWVKSQSLVGAASATLRLLRRLRRVQWDWAIEVRGDIRQILLAALSGAARRISFAFTGGAALLTDVIPDDGRLAHLAEHHRRILRHLGLWSPEQSYVPRLHLTASEAARAASIEPFVGFHFGASIELRRLAVADAARLVNAWAGRRERLVLFEPPDMREYNAELRLLLSADARARLETWRGALRDFIVMASRAKQMFTMDSGPAHIAAALDVPTVVFFGPNRPEYAAPIGANVHVVEIRDLPCRPCQNRCINAIHQACLRTAIANYLQAEGCAYDGTTGAGDRAAPSESFVE